MEVLVVYNCFNNDNPSHCANMRLFSRSCAVPSVTEIHLPHLIGLPYVALAYIL